LWWCKQLVKLHLSPLRPNLTRSVSTDVDGR
jgi:hypothetical protein